MSNSRIFQASYPAERMRGARLVTDFRDAATMLRDGWTSFGSPTYYKGGGVNLNGSTQYLTRPLAEELYTTALTIHYEFYPAFATSEDARRYLLDTYSAGAGRVIIRKNETPTLANSLRIYLGAGTLVSTIAEATYSPYWVVNGRNLLSISGVSGATTIWLNGVQIATSATAWTATPGITTMYLGSNNATTEKFYGRVGRLYIQHNTSTLQEHSDIYNNKTWKWEEALSYFFPFTTGCYDPTNKRTLDGRTSSLYATLGNGAGTGEPTQSRGHLVFDGVNDYLSGIADPAGSFTVMGVKDTGTGWTFFSDNDLTNWTPIFTSGGFTGKLSYLAVAPSVLTETQELDAKYKWISTIGSKI